MISHLWQYLFESTLQYLLSETTVGESIVKSPYDLLSHFYATFFVRDPLTTYIYIHTYIYTYIYTHICEYTIYLYIYIYLFGSPFGDRDDEGSYTIHYTIAYIDNYSTYGSITIPLHISILFYTIAYMYVSYVHMPIGIL